MSAVSNHVGTWLLNSWYQFEEFRVQLVPDDEYEYLYYFCLENSTLRVPIITSMLEDVTYPTPVVVADHLRRALEEA